METIILDQIPFQADLNDLMTRLHVRPGTSNADEFEQLVREAQQIARPKAMYGAAYLNEKDDTGAIIEGIRFSSRVLRVNMEEVYRVFPFVATCGAELGAWADGLDDVLHEYWAEGIKQAALTAATQALNNHLIETFRPGHLAAMNPGSLADWPLREQRPLFRLLGNPQEAIGVELTDSCLMVPNKSVSGIRFPTEASYENCQLCPREGCPGRRAPYDRELYDRKYRLPAHEM